MRITFGISSDGADWSQKSVSLGEIKFGPLQFLAWLEGRSGLDRVSISMPERINEYMQLRLYRKSVEASTGKPVKQTIIHLPEGALS